VNPIQQILIAGVRAYQWTLSPALHCLFGPHCGCRYTPTCSEFAIEALRNHGALTGSWLALKRIGRCHPWGGCGHDPVPHNVSHIHPLQKCAADAGTSSPSTRNTIPPTVRAAAFQASP
jgi:hypothetical protein